MKAVIFAGGLGTRLSEETSSRPKPMVEIGERPLLWHIMKIYSFYDINEFIICCGFKGYVIKEYFNNYFLHMSDVTIDIQSNQMEIHNQRAEPWKITLLDTGQTSMTGGRLLQTFDYLKDEEAFCLTYGDGVSDVNIKSTIEFHEHHGHLATVTATRPPARFGAINMDSSGLVVNFEEKPVDGGAIINGGFFVLSPKIFEYLGDHETVWEQAPLKNLSRDGELMAYQHNGFWHPMDTLRDKKYLEELWQSGKAPWKLWD